MATGASFAVQTLRQHHIEALSRRAALHQGAVRQLLDEKLLALRATEAAEPRPPSAPAPAPTTASSPSVNPLTALLAHITQHSLEPGGPGEQPLDAGAAPAPRELKAVRDYRSTWSRLSVEQRVNQALARVPNNAGPLNTQRLVHEALTALRNASPAYMHRLVTQVEALLWLERLGHGEGAQRVKKRAERTGAAAAAAAAAATGSGRS